MQSEGREMQNEENGIETSDTANPTAIQLPEGFILIQGGTFQMGSPEEEA